jgi:hypothetical protein
MRRHHLTEFGDLDVEDVDELDLPGHDRRVGGLHWPGLTQLRGMQRLLDRGGLGVDVAAVARRNAAEICERESTGARRPDRES